MARAPLHADTDPWSDLSPVSQHMAEDAFQSLPEACKPQGIQSVFQAGWGDVPAQWGSVPADELALLEAVIQASPF
jgi:hypothetical protein